jgi:serine/threonine protein kinase
MVQSDGHASVMDFGIAKIVQLDSRQSSVILGSPKYMAPEQLRYERPTKLIDQWALAVTAYEMLSGRSPFEDTGKGLPYEIQNSDPKPIDPIVLHGPISRALSKRADSRYSTCIQFIDALESANRYVRQKTHSHPKTLLEAAKRPLPKMMMGIASGVFVIGSSAVGWHWFWAPPIKKPIAMGTMPTQEVSNLSA